MGCAPSTQWPTGETATQHGVPVVNCSLQNGGASTGDPRRNSGGSRTSLGGPPDSTRPHLRQGGADLRQYFHATCSRIINASSNPLRPQRRCRRQGGDGKEQTEHRWAQTRQKMKTDRRKCYQEIRPRDKPENETRPSDGQGSCGAIDIRKQTSLHVTTEQREHSKNVARSFACRREAILGATWPLPRAVGVRYRDAHVALANLRLSR